MADLDLAIRLRADGSGLVGQVRRSRQEIERLGDETRQTGREAQRGRRRWEQYARSQRDVRRSIGSTIGRMRVLHLAIAALVTGVVVRGGLGLVTAASDAEEAANKFDAVFKDLAAEARAWAAEHAAAVGRSRLDLEVYLATLQDTFVPLGFARDQAADLAKTLTRLGIDLASFNNAAEPETIDLLTSAIVGNHEAVRRYGIVITEATLKQELLARGITGGTAAASEQEKALARVAIIVRSTADAQGDAERTSEGYANQVKELAGNFKDLKVAIGEELLPVATEFITFLNDNRGAIGGFFRGAGELLGIVDRPVSEQLARLRYLREAYAAEVSDFFSLDLDQHLQRIDAELAARLSDAPFVDALVADLDRRIARLTLPLRGQRLAGLAGPRAGADAEDPVPGVATTPDVPPESPFDVRRRALEAEHALLGRASERERFILEELAAAGVAVHGLGNLEALDDFIAGLDAEAQALARTAGALYDYGRAQDEAAAAARDLEAATDLAAALALEAELLSRGARERAVVDALIRAGIPVRIEAGQSLEDYLATLGEEPQLLAAAAAALHDKTAADDEAGQAASRHADAVADIAGRYRDLIGPLEAATQAADEWREEALEGLDEAAMGYEEFAAMVESIHGRMIVDALDAEERARTDWLAGVKRGLGEAATDAEQFEELTAGALLRTSDAWVRFVETGKLELEDFGAYIRDWAARYAADRFLNPLLNVGLDFIGSLFAPGPGKIAGRAPDAPLLHGGGVAGALGGVSRAVPAGLFAGAPRYHAGGLAGDEVPAILRRGEGVFTPEQMAVLSPGPPAVRIEFVNQGTQQRETGREVRWDGRAWVVSIMIDDVINNGPFRQALSGETGWGETGV